MDSERVFVYFLEGTHGVGKTTLIAALKQVGFMTVEEDFMYKYSGFLSCPDHAFLTEAAWAGDCLNKVIIKAKKLREYRKIGIDSFRGNPKIDRYCQLPPIIFVDRSYVTGLIYGVIKDPFHFDLYEHVCQEAMDSLIKGYNIEPYVVRVKVEDLDSHIEKVIKRAKNNNLRQSLNELDINFLKYIEHQYDIYEEHKRATDLNPYFDYLYYNHYTDLDNDGNINIDLAHFMRSIDAIENYPLALDTLKQKIKPVE